MEIKRVKFNSLDKYINKSENAKTLKEQYHQAKGKNSEDELNEREMF